MRYIDADKIQITAERGMVSEGLIFIPMVDAQRSIDATPTADVAEVRHGEWEIKSRSYRMIDDYDEEVYVECPYCKRTFDVPYELDDEKIIAYARKNYPYCHCGAKMDGERREASQ